MRIVGDVRERNRFPIWDQSLIVFRSIDVDVSSVERDGRQRVSRLTNEEPRADISG